MATIAVGSTTFTSAGATSGAFTWADAETGAPVTFGARPTILFGPCQTVTAGGPTVPFFNGTADITTTGGTITLAGAIDGDVTVVAIGS